ncbi:MAG TPA: DUF971 domain-containing protein [Phycisphaerae bacterium]|nr:DUF971 domain-containing protein [Phycisphaerae bacterium]
MTPNQLIDLALNQPLTADQFKPVDLHLDRRDGLTIEWADSRRSTYSLAYLRKSCPCAGCRTERETPKPKTSSMSLTVLPENISRAVEFANAKLVGKYAIQIEWADGHNTGIYDFRYLRLIDPAGANESAPSPV